jgi:hypothetical protein
MTLRSAVLVGAACCLLWLALVAAQHRLVEDRPEDLGAGFGYNLPPPSMLKSAALGFQDVVADGLWLAVIQEFAKFYIEEGRSDRATLRAFVEIIDSITLIDPDWRTVYVNGGSILRTVGAFDASTMLNLRGVEQFPDDWYFPFQVAMNYWESGNKSRAAEFMIEAAARSVASPKAPAHLSALAATMLQHGDQGQMAIAMLEEQLRQITVPRARRQTELSLLDARLCLGRKQIQRAFEDALLWNNRAVRSPAALVGQGFLDAVPDCPLGGNWYWDATLQSFHCEGFDQARARFMVDRGFDEAVATVRVRCR